MNLIDELLREAREMRDKISNDTQLWEARHAAQVDKLEQLEARNAELVAEVERLKADVQIGATFIKAYERNTLSNDEEYDDDDAHLHSESCAVQDVAAENAKLREVVTAMSDADILYGPDRDPGPPYSGEPPTAVSFPTEDGEVWWGSEELATALAAARAALAHGKENETSNPTT